MSPPPSLSTRRRQQKLLTPVKSLPRCAWRMARLGLGGFLFPHLLLCPHRQKGSFLRRVRHFFVAEFVRRDREQRETHQILWLGLY